MDLDQRTSVEVPGLGTLHVRPIGATARERLRCEFARLFPVGGHLRELDEFDHATDPLRAVMLEARVHAPFVAPSAEGMEMLVNLLGLAHLTRDDGATFDLSDREQIDRAFPDTKALVNAALQIIGVLFADWEPARN